MGKIVAFANQKGGVGKTTTCINLSSYLASFGKRVLILDIDPQGNSTTGVGVEKVKGLKTIYNVICGENDISEVVIKTQIKNLEIIPVNQDLVGAELELVQMKGREKKLKEYLDSIKASYDFICIDCPPSLSLLTVNALTAADSVFIPIQCEFFALEGLSQLMNSVKLIKRAFNPNLEVEGVLLTMEDKRATLTKQVASEINKYFGKKVFRTRIPRSIRLAEAPSHGKPIMLYDKKCNGAIAYYLLSKEFLERQPKPIK
ncbi:MAG: AAA family ATPase [Firmicutes bacterium]|nr:AAA family ATPase [Bacillota bacterium]